MDFDNGIDDTGQYYADKDFAEREGFYDEYDEDDDDDESWL